MDNTNVKIQQMCLDYVNKIYDIDPKIKKNIWFLSILQLLVHFWSKILKLYFCKKNNNQLVTIDNMISIPQD